MRRRIRVGQGYLLPLLLLCGMEEENIFSSPSLPPSPWCLRRPCCHPTAQACPHLEHGPTPPPFLPRCPYLPPPSRCLSTPTPQGTHRHSCTRFATKKNRRKKDNHVIQVTTARDQHLLFWAWDNTPPFSPAWHPVCNPKSSNNRQRRRPCDATPCNATLLKADKKRPSDKTQV